MQQVLLSIVFLFFAQIVAAQNWAPINTTDKYNYKADTASAISHTLWVDSVGFDGLDSIYYPNRIVVNYPDSLNNGYTGIALRNQSQFLNKRVTVLPNGVYLLSEPTTISYYSLSRVGDSYTYDSTENITATVLALDETTILGNLDSIKTLLLSTGDTIIASKNHGLVQYPMEYGRGKYYRLVGIEGGRNLGEHVAKFDDFFNYAVGDTFWYYYRDNYWAFDEIIDVRGKVFYSIDTLIQIGDTIYYGHLPQARYTKFNIDVPQNDVNLYPNTLAHSYLSYPDSINRVTYNLQYFQGRVGNNTGNCQSHTTSESYLRPDNRRVKTFRHFYCDNSQNDTIGYTLQNPGEIGNYHRVFVERLGLVQIEMSGFENVGFAVMYAYRLAGDSTLTILDQDLFDLVIGIEEPTTNSFQLLGNPVSNTLSIQLAIQQPLTLTLYNLNGQQLLQQQTQETNITMDVSHLPQGVYLLEVRSQNGVSRQRVVKM